MPHSRCVCGWSGKKNVDLLALADPQFDVLLTLDKNLPYQQNLQVQPVAVVLLSAVSNELTVLLHLLSALEDALAQFKPGSFVRVGR